MKNLSKPTIPKETDADVAMSVIIPHIQAIEGDNVSYEYDFCGVSERTALGDVLSINIRNRQNNTPKVRFTLKRDSLYHILPEYLFHTLDHYFGSDGDTDEFDKLYKEQEEQKKKALTYFQPFDQHFQQLRIVHQRWLNENIFEGNRFLADFITDRGSSVNLSNPYIRAAYPCIVWLKEYRGSEEMIRTAFGYAFKGQLDILKERILKEEPFTADIPSTLGGELGCLFCGSTFKYSAWKWKVFHQKKIDTASNLKELKQLIKEFHKFFAKWFMPVETDVEITFGDRLAPPILSDAKSKRGIFLNYSTQLI